MIRRIVATMIRVTKARKVTYLVTTLLYMSLLCMTASANAAEVPGSWCSRDDASRCYTQDATDTHVVTYSPTPTSWYIYSKDIGGQRGFSVSAIGCSLVNYYGSSSRTVGPTTCTKIMGRFEYHSFKRFHKYRITSPWIQSQYALFLADDGVLSDASTKLAPWVDIQASANAANCHDVDNNPVTWNVEQGYRFKVDAPQDFKDACAGQVKEPGATTTTPTADPTTKPPATDTTTACPVVAVGKKKAKIITINLPCLTGRNVMAKFLRSGVEPSGYVCVAAKIGRSKVGKCVREGSGRTKRPTVTGSYRFR